MEKTKTERPNILFILLDALRADHLGCYGYSKPTSPNIDEIAKRGILFANCFATTNTTDASVTSIFSGFYPRSHGILHHSYKVTAEELAAFNRRNIKLFPEILKENGYQTFGLDWLGRWHQKGYDYYHGLNLKRTKQKEFIGKAGNLLKKVGLYPLAKKLYQNHVVRRLFGKVELYGNDYLLTKKTVEIIQETADPFFIFLHYYDTHAPYVASRKYRRMFYDPKTKFAAAKSFDNIKNPKVRQFYEQWTKKEKDFAGVIARYDGSIRHLDDQIGEILAALRQAGKLSNTIIIITSDHGENLAENEILFDHHSLYEGSLAAPLILAFPEGRPSLEINFPLKIKSVVQHVDLMPTLISLLNLQVNINQEKVNLEEMELDGFDLMEIMEDQRELRSLVYAEEVEAQKKRCIRTKDYKLILATDPNDAACSRCGGLVHGGKKELYHLKNDPQEAQNMLELNAPESDISETYTHYQELALKLEQELNQFLQGLDQKMSRREAAYNFQNNSKNQEAFPKEDEEKVKARLKRLESLGYVD